MWVGEVDLKVREIDQYATIYTCSTDDRHIIRQSLLLRTEDAQVREVIAEVEGVLWEVPDELLHSRSICTNGRHAVL